MASLSLVKLINRKLIKISGPDCYPYLQGLFCNDLRYLYEPQRIPKRLHANATASVLSSFMLNAQGRVICDVLFYRTPRTRFDCEFTPPGEASEHDELLIECDAGLANGLANTLYGYRVRRKVSLEILYDQQVWCLYPNLHNKSVASFAQDSDDKQLLDLKALKHTDIVTDDVTIVSDPRIDLMGLRIITRAQAGVEQIKAVLGSQLSEHPISESSVQKYTVHRYNLGLGEGPKDHLESNCFPLECNADLTGSVSFDKGCYLGQELTARVHFTGVVRKRLMPCLLDLDKNKPLELPLVAGSDIIDSNGKRVGVLRHVVRNHALSLMRHEQILPDAKLSLEATKVKLTTWRPYWWNVG